MGIMTRGLNENFFLGHDVGYVERFFNWVLLTGRWCYGDDMVMSNSTIVATMRKHCAEKIG